MNDAGPSGVELCDERGELHASFLPEAGMLCHSLRRGGVELLAQNAGVEVYVERGKTMGIPLLYPWANRLAASSYTAGGRSVEIAQSAPVGRDPNGLPIHGVIGGRMRWELCESPGGGNGSSAGGRGKRPAVGGADSGTPGDGGGTLRARLRWSEAQGELFGVFPFAHDVLYDARLADGSLEIAVTVEACRGERVPVAFGFHPYLAPPEVQRECWRVALPAMRQLVLDDRQIPVGVGESLAACSFELDGREFDHGFEGLAPGAHFQLGAGACELAVELVEGYSCAQLYAPRSRATICFEPMVAPANALCSGNGLRVLEAGESHRATFAVRVAERAA